MRILYVGILAAGSTSLMRMEALRTLGHDVEGLDTTPPARAGIFSRVVRRMEVWVRHQRDIVHVDRRLAEAGKRTFDIIWLDKQLTVRPETLRTIKAAQPGRLIVGFTPDDMMNPMNRTRRFLRGLRYYDAYFTTKSFGVRELEAAGAPKAHFVANGFDPATHKPWPLAPEDAARLGADVGFVGTYESDRAGQIDFLAGQGIKVKVYGSGWKRPMHPNVEVIREPVIGTDYAKTIVATKVNLCFLRKANRDRQTTRSVEIPACGGFMLAERTDEHRDLFEEGREAAYFDRRDELLAKVRYYLEHDAERATIAAAGRTRCEIGGYSYPDRMRQILAMIGGR